MENAIEKINKEIQKKPNDVYTEIVGHYIIDRISTSKETADAINSGKTLEGAMDAIKQAARKIAVDGVGVVRDNEIFDIIDNYLFVSKDDNVRNASKASVDGLHEEKSSNATGIDIDFEDLI